jgi:hypothetical protein
VTYGAVKIPTYLYRRKSGIYYLRMPGKKRKSLRIRHPEIAKLIRIQVESTEMLDIEHEGTKLHIEYDGIKDGM